jgi:NADPH-dependent 2,4-dienoyl-CoA reductase/sulfur reductase-like enzyme/nitrite reductase/ring-hydroxylating ferredoxin subunit
MNFKDIVAANINDLNEGEMKSFDIAEDQKVLLVKINGKFHAIGGLCPHYGAPLDEGVLSGDRIVCPWHHAAYDARSGDLKEPPALDALAHYETRIEGENVIVRVPEPFEGSRTPHMTKFDPEADKRTFVIIGAGAAGNAAAQTLREEGFQGRIVMITYENRLPYDRPQLSKEYMEGKSDEGGTQLRPEEFYREHDIEIMFQTKVTGIDIVKKMISFESGGNISYDKALIATGGIPRRLDIPGADLGNIFTLRSFDDANRIFQASEKANNIVIVGSSFIAMEVANAFRERKRCVTVATRDSVPFETTLGPELGKMFRDLHERNGVDFRFETELDRFEGEREVQAVVLKDGDQIKCDMVILGVGVRPATDFLRDTGMLSPDGSIRVDDHFRAGQDIFAAGDIATFPEWRAGEEVRIEHWRTSQQQGFVAGRNMAGIDTPYRSVPFFWTNQVGLYFRYVGHARRWDDIIFHGDIAGLDFIAFYVRNNRVCAAAGNNREKEMDAIEELMRLDKMPSPDKLRDESVSMVDLLNDLNSRLRQAA